MSETDTYIITAWLEGKEWRYQVRHVHSGEERHFPRLEDVSELLSEQTGVSPLSPRQERKLKEPSV